MLGVGRPMLVVRCMAILNSYRMFSPPLVACSWELLPGSMASKRGGHAVAAAGGQLYALGGFDSVQAIPHCEAYEPRVSGACCNQSGEAVCVGKLPMQSTWAHWEAFGLRASIV